VVTEGVFVIVRDCAAAEGASRLANRKSENCGKNDSGAAKLILCRSETASCGDAQRMYDTGLEGIEIFKAFGVMTRHNFSVHTRRRVEFMGRIAAENGLTGNFFDRMEAMDAEPIGIFREDHIARAKFGLVYGSDDNIVSILKIRAHALAVRAELNGIPATKQSGAKLFE
jgi:hypothetical protein